MEIMLLTGCPITVGHQVYNYALESHLHRQRTSVFLVKAGYKAQSKTPPINRQG